MFRPGGPTGSAESVDAFSANAETPLGVLGSVLTLGGVWDPTAYVPGRDNVLLAVLALVVTLGRAGRCRARPPAAGTPRPVSGVAVLAAIGVVIALLGGLDATRSVIESLVDDVPGGAMLADGHVWLAPLALLARGRLRLRSPAWLVEQAERAGRQTRWSPWSA